MEFKDVKIKETFTTEELNNAIEMVVSFIIDRDENGVRYTPYNDGYAYSVAIVTYLLDGVNVDDSTIMEAITAVQDNEELSSVVQKFMDEENNPARDYIITNVEKIVEFKKNLYINDWSDIKEKLAKSIDKEILLNDTLIELAKSENKALQQQIEMNERSEEVAKHMTPEEIAKLNKRFADGEFDTAELTESLLKKFMSSDERKAEIQAILAKK